MPNPQNGKATTVQEPPATGRDVRTKKETDLNRTGQTSHRLRAALIFWLAAAVASFGLALAAQTAGRSIGWRLEREGRAGLGKPFEAVLASGHYTAGIDLPAGRYDVRAQEGKGSLSASAGTCLLSVSGEKPFSASMGLELQPGDRLTITGVTLKMRTERSLSAAKGRTEDAAAPLELNGISSEESGSGAVRFTAGRDFPAGEYDLTALEGGGLVSSDNLYSGGIYCRLSVAPGDGEAGSFRNVSLPEGTVLSLTGVRLRLIPMGV